jgi:hypothetical protein
MAATLAVPDPGKLADLLYWALLAMQFTVPVISIIALLGARPRS